MIPSSSPTPPPSPSPLPETPSPLPETLKCKVLTPISRSRTDRLQVGQETELKPEEILPLVELDPPAVEPLPLTPKMKINSADAQEIGVKLGVRSAIAQSVIQVRDSLGGKITSFDQLKGIWGIDIQKVQERAELG